MAGYPVQNTEDPRITRFARPCKYSLNYGNMMIGDVWGTTSNSPIAVGIKMRTWGFLSALSLIKCNHVAIVVKIQDQFFLAESLFDGLRITSCYAYLNPSIRNFSQRVCWMGRHEQMTDYDRGKINEAALALAADFPNYDFEGVGSFLCPWFLKQKPSRFFCSEFIAYVMRATSNKLMIDRRSDAISPAAFQKYPLMADVTRSILIK